MKIPKRFKMHEIGDVYVTSDNLIAADHAAAVRVPITRGHCSRDLPNATENEMLGGSLPEKVMQIATTGTKGIGELVLSAGVVEVRGGLEKPWTRYEREGHDIRLPAIIDLLARASDAPPDTHRAVEVCLDAEALVRVARAIGAGEAVRLTFAVNSQGRCDESCGTIHIEPIREAAAGEGVLMAHVVSGDQQGKQ